MPKELKRRLFVNHRDHPELVEALSNVKRGTYFKYKILMDQVPKYKCTEFWSNQRLIDEGTEHFKREAKKNPQLKRIHRFLTEGIGPINESKPGQTKDARKIKKFLTELYYSHDKHFWKYYTNSTYTKDWYEYVHLVRSIGVYW